MQRKARTLQTDSTVVAGMWGAMDTCSSCMVCRSCQACSRPPWPTQYSADHRGPVTGADPGCCALRLTCGVNMSTIYEPGHSVHRMAVFRGPLALLQPPDIAATGVQHGEGTLRFLDTASSSQGRRVQHSPTSSANTSPMSSAASCVAGWPASCMTGSQVQPQRRKQNILVALLGSRDAQCPLYTCHRSLCCCQPLTP